MSADTWDLAELDLLARAGAAERYLRERRLQQHTAMWAERVGTRRRRQPKVVEPAPIRRVRARADARLMREAARTRPQSRVLPRRRMGRVWGALFGTSWRIALVLAMVFTAGAIHVDARVLLGAAALLLAVGLMHRPARRVWRWLLAGGALAYVLPLLPAPAYSDGLALTLVGALPAGIGAAWHRR